MKKLCVFMAIILLFLLATGCKKQPADHSNSVAASTALPNPTEATDAKKNENATPADGQNEPAVVSIEKEFYNLIINDTLYRRALGCTFEKPEDISVWFYFYNGVSNKEVNWQSFTDEEIAFVNDTFRDSLEVGTALKLPTEEINKDLSVLGVTIADIQIPDRWVYNEKTDAYYYTVSDAFGVGRWSVTKVEKGENGMVAVYWKPEGLHFNTATGEHMKNAKMVMTLQEQPDGTYRVLSNVPQE